MWRDILYLVVGIIGGLIAGFFIAKHMFQKQLKENPPISEEMIKTLMRGMGRQPSEEMIKTLMRGMGRQPSQKQVNQLMKQMQKYQ